jgi:hypothetical protein
MAQIIKAGDDPFSTPGGGGTHVDLSSYPIQQIFGAPVDGDPVVSLVGESLGPGPELAGIDTIMRRSKDITIGSAGSGAGPLEIVALRLVSEQPVSIGKVSYRMRVFLSEFHNNIPSGTLTLRMANGDGGTFDSSFTVRPKLVFTNADTKQSTVIDCGAVPCGTGSDLTMHVSGASFARSGGPGKFTGQGIKTLRAGIAVDSDGNGTLDATTLASTNLYIGVRPVPPFNPGPTDKDEQSANHRFLPPTASAQAAVLPYSSF